jgi:RimJ/RimL family protein N-acetyltransferase
MGNGHPVEGISPIKNSLSTNKKYLFKMNPDESMPIQFECPHCRSNLSFPSRNIGTVQECPFCNEMIVVLRLADAINRKLPLPIRTTRLTLKCFAARDRQEFVDLVREEEAYRYLDHYWPDVEIANFWFDNAMKARFTHPKGILPLKIETTSQPRTVGHLALFSEDDEEHRQAGVFIMIHRDMRRQGYGTEALRSLFQFAFEGIGLHDVRVRIDIRNQAACRMVERAGMKLEGQFLEECRVKGEWTTGAYYGILASEWARVQMAK